MAPILSRLKIPALVVAGLIATYLLFAWLALPWILQSQAEKLIAEKSGHHLTMERPQFNPFNLKLQVAGLRLAQPDNTPLLAWRELVVDLSAESITHAALVFDDVRLDGLEANVALLPDRRLNWSALIDALKGKEEKPKSALPRFDLHHFALTGAQVDFADHRMKPAFTTRIEPMDVELTEISSLPDEHGQYKLAARTAFGARLLWQGDASLNPLAATGSIQIDDLDLARLEPYFRSLLPIAPPRGVASLAAHYRLDYGAGKLGLALEEVAARLTGLHVRVKRGAGQSVAVHSIEARDGRFDLASNRVLLGAVNLKGIGLEVGRGDAEARKALEVDHLALENAHIDLASRHVTLGRMALTGGRFQASRNAGGRIDLVDALAAPAPAASAPAESAPAKAKSPPPADWHYRVDKVELAGLAATLRDESVKPAAELGLDDVTLTAHGITDDLKAPILVRAAFKFRDGGSFEADGKVVPAVPSANLQVKLADLSLKPAQPYLSAVAKLKLTNGKLSSTGRAAYDGQGPSYRGDLAVRDLRLNDAETGGLFLVWKSLSSRDIGVTPAKADIPELVLDGLDTQLIINKDKSVSFQRLLRQAPPPATPPKATAPKPGNPPPPAFLVNVDRLRIRHSELDFADKSLALPFGTRIHELKGTVTGLSSRPGTPGQVEMEGQVDDYGLARAAGRIDLFNPKDFMDLKVAFRNIEMTRLTPYSATFAGRKIASGKLSLDLEYRVHQHRLEGDNKVVMDRLTLGERVESPEALNLPLDLAIAVLQDANGRINLGVPVSGSLDDPQFSYGRIIWKAIVNVVSNVATAPFRALGRLFGGGEKIDTVAFGAGEAQLSPPEREKLVTLANGLAKRPKLSLAIHGVYSDADRVALQDRQVRRALAARMGLPLEAGEDSDPGLLSTAQPKVQAALESLFADRFGSGELAAYKEGFRRANPGQLQESGAKKVLSKLSGAFREKHVLSDEEAARLRGADFYVVLFERLRDRTEIGDDRLLALAKARGEQAAAILKGAGAPPDRLAVLAPEKVDAKDRDVPLKLELGTAPGP